jgi:ABC-type multidrug transport system fused ATPase/permease subunit
MEGMAVIYTTLEETFRSIKIVKAFTNERQERNRYHKNAKHYLKKAMKIAAYDSLVHPITEIMGIFSVCLPAAGGIE